MFHGAARFGVGKEDRDRRPWKEIASIVRTQESRTLSPARNGSARLRSREQRCADFHQRQYRLKPPPSGDSEFGRGGVQLRPYSLDTGSRSGGLGLHNCSSSPASLQLASDAYLPGEASTDSRVAFCGVAVNRRRANGGKCARRSSEKYCLLKNREG